MNSAHPKYIPTVPMTIGMSSSPLPTTSTNNVLSSAPLSELALDNLVPPHSLSFLQPTDPAPLQYSPHTHISQGVFATHDTNHVLLQRDGRLRVPTPSSIPPRSSILQPSGAINVHSHLSPLGPATSTHNGPAIAFSDVLNAEINAAIQNLSLCGSVGTPRIKNDLYKTEICRSFAENGGYCKYGGKCQFAHGEAELRPVRRHPRYKTKLCRNFLATGSCPYDTRCRFIHAPVDLIGSSVEAASPRTVSKTSCTVPNSALQYPQVLSACSPNTYMYAGVPSLSHPDLMTDGFPPVPLTSAVGAEPSLSFGACLAPLRPAPVFSSGLPNVGLDGEHLCTDSPKSNSVPEAIGSSLQDHMLTKFDSVFSNYEDGFGVGPTGISDTENGLNSQLDGCSTIGDDVIGGHVGVYSVSQLVDDDLVSENETGGDILLESDGGPAIIKNIRRSIGDFGGETVNTAVELGNYSSNGTSASSRSRLPVFQNMMSTDD